MSDGVFIQCVNVQVHFKQDKNSRKLLGKLNRKPSALPDIEDCSKCPESSSSLHSQGLFT